MMSKRDAHKVSVIDECCRGIITNATATRKLDLSVRQIQRLKRKAERSGPIGVLHGNRNREPINKTPIKLRLEIENLAKGTLAGYNFSHFRDVLEDEKNINVSRATLARVLTSMSIQSSRKHRKPRTYSRRKRRECRGDLVQMDAFKSDWLNNRSYLYWHGQSKTYREKY